MYGVMIVNENVDAKVQPMKTSAAEKLPIYSTHNFRPQSTCVYSLVYGSQRQAIATRFTKLNSL